MFYNVLDKKRQNILPLLSYFKKEFYLAGGTALALQLGYRSSVDFDYFANKDIDTDKVLSEIKIVFKGHKILKVREEENTLIVLIDEGILLSFFGYKYKLIKSLIKEEYFNLASIEDIGCTKFSAIIGRKSNKDYIDLYYILQEIKLRELLELAGKKFPEIDTNLIIKNLVYFKDIENSPIKFKNNNKITLKEVEKFMKRAVVLN
ncbi:MAG: nucleotidyl transferase AbiEii/AbiGii toxin family protein [Candidatus Paceibacterota bacterium]|jgi:predicted nucleotidyltransferase component of viral defense system